MKYLMPVLMVLILAGCSSSYQRNTLEADGSTTTTTGLYEFSPTAMMLPDFLKLRDELTTHNGQIVQRMECQAQQYDNGRYKQDCKITKPKQP